MYQALYRKWRPHTFDEVKGQDAIVTTLKNQIKSGRIGHAYLFCGTRGTGKTSVAKIMARAVNCTHTQDGNPCNECDICRSILSESSMNVSEIDAASNNGVDNIRDIKEQVQYPPTEGRYKVFIIDEVHMLSPGAFNALLKTLEEPPEYVIFILATTEVHKIPVTVLSRCQRYDFKRITVDVIADRIRELTNAEGIDIEDRACTYIAKRADGAMRDALSLLDECAAFIKQGEEITYDKVLKILGTADTAEFIGLFGSVIAADTLKALRIVENAVDQGKELSQFATDFLWFMRNLLVIKTAEDASGIVDASKEDYESMRSCAAKVSRESIMRYIKIVAELINRMRYSSQKRVLLELALIRMITPQVDNDLDSLTERIQRLENGSFRAASPAQTYTGPDEYALAETPKAKNPKVKIEKAKYEDLMMLRDNWQSLIEELAGAGRTLLRDTGIEPGEGDIMTVTFTNKGRYELSNRESLIAELTDAAFSRFGKAYDFRMRYKDSGENETEYVTAEELSELIKMDIDFEDE